jgi:Flagellar hook-basal body complex protein FliE
MVDNEFHQIEKMLPYKTKLKSRTYIKDGDLQIHIPTTKEAHLDPAINFKSIYAHFLNEAGTVPGEETSSTIQQSQDIKIAMQDAKNAFDSMMQIREQLRQAYQEFIQMQS